MENNTISKINKLGKAGYIISKISRIAILTTMIACLVGAVLMCFISKETVRLELESSNKAIIYVNDSLDYLNLVDLGDDGSVVDMSIELGRTEFELSMDENDEPVKTKTVFYLSNLKWLLFGCVLACAAAYVTLHFAEELCGHFKDCDSPFTEESSKGIVRLAWSLIPLSLISSVVESASDSILTGNVDIVLGVDLTIVLLILCVFMLSYVFKYGTALQVEADETL